MAWHDTDPFWLTMGRVMFHSRRWAGTSAEVDHLVQLLQLPAGAAILDLPCGPGRHSLELARRGFDVTGVDRTRAYLDQAQAASTAEGLSVRWAQGDMRTWRQPDRFHAALNLWSSFGYFEDPADDRRHLESVLASLAPGGTLVLDTMSLEILARDFSESSVLELDGSLLIERRRIIGPWTAIESTWTLLQGDTREERTMRVRLYSARHLAGLLHQVGFTDIEILGGLDGVPFDHKAKRLVLLARKPTPS
jgi:SAM-dependent methyltransferase